MRVILLCILFVSLANAQLGFLGNLGNRVNNRVNALADNVQTGLAKLKDQFKSVPLVNNVKNFEDFLKQTGRKYADGADRALRQGFFETAKKAVENNNAAFAAGAAPFKMALNAFSDLSESEFFKFLTGRSRSAKGNQKASNYHKEEEVAVMQIPDSFDWREKGGVTSVKFQGLCNSCWSFAAVGAIEGHVFAKSGNLPSLSEQNLVDCGNPEFALFGCESGHHEYGLAYLTEQKGVAKLSTYPYVDKEEKCKYEASKKGAEIYGYSKVPSLDEDTMKSIIAQKGPLACGMKTVLSMREYKTGIFYDDECKPQDEEDLNHSVLVVGYGTEDGQDYWIVKNSWDKNWGENGYFRLPRGKNACGIAIECVYPKV